MPIELTKALQLSKYKIYFDGDPFPYIAEVKFPKIVSPTEDFDNTSTGGKFTVGDPFRLGPDGNGEIKFEADTQSVIANISDPTKIVSLNCALIQNNMNPLLGAMVALPINYRVSCQFIEFDPGSIVQGKKREIMGNFTMFALKIQVNGLTAIDHDYVNGTFDNSGKDLLAGVTNLLG